MNHALVALGPFVLAVSLLPSCNASTSESDDGADLSRHDAPDASGIPSDSGANADVRLRPEGGGTDGGGIDGPLVGDSATLDGPTDEASGEAGTGRVDTPIDGDSTYKLVFDEEFNGANLDLSKWAEPNLVRDTTYSTYPCEYLSQNITVASGFLDMAVTKGPTPSGAAYGTAGLTGQVTVSYGYWEARIRTPENANGVSSTWWTDTSPSWTYPEVDIFEHAGIEPMTNHTTYHYNGDGTNGVGITHSNSGIAFADAFHVVAALTTPSEITFYVDGVSEFTVSQGTSQLATNAQWPLLVATAGGLDDNLVDGTTVLPAHFRIDYVHVYSNDPGAVAAEPEAGYGGPGDSLGSGN